MSSSAKKSAADIYVFDVDPESDTAAANVLRLVGCEKDVLEIGAGPGSIARPLALLNRCRVSALEYDVKCLPILRTFCETVVQGDLNSTDWSSKFAEQSFDAIVIADVLEHLLDPWETLRSTRKLLKPGGSVVSSIPNASHAAMLASFMNDNVDYRDWGLLDRTHIRFFGVRNIQELFRQAGLKIVEARYVVRTPEMTEFVDNWRITSAAAREALEAAPFAHVYQTVVRAIDIETLSQPELELASAPPPRPGAAVMASPTPLPPSRRPLKQMVGRVLGARGRRVVKSMLGMK